MTVDYSKLANLHDGDLVLYKRKPGDGIFSWAICAFTKGPYKHVSIVQWIDKHPYVIEAKYGIGVRRVSLQSQVDDGEDMVFCRIMNGMEPLSKHDGRLFAFEAEQCVDQAGYDVTALPGFIRIITHKLFKFIPLVNPLDDTGKFWCSELAREKFTIALKWDFLEDIEPGFESPNDIARPYPDGRERVKVL